MKGQSTQTGREYLQNISNKRLISKIYKELLKMQKKENKSIKKWTKDLNWHFHQWYTDD